MQATFPRIQDLFSRAEALGFPFVMHKGGHLVGRMQWERARDGGVPLPPADLEDIARGLADEEAAQGRAHASIWPARPAEAPDSELDSRAASWRETVDKERLEEAAAAEAFAKTTPGLLTRMIELLESIDKRLDKR
jgi:hypothetical protein